MDNLQKDRAIYDELCRIAQKYFLLGVQTNESFRNLMLERSVISLRELTDKDCLEWRYGAECSIPWEEEHVTVGNFSCTFSGENLFKWQSLLTRFKSLAKVKEELTFTYDEPITRPLAATLTLTFDNPHGAANLCKLTLDDKLYPQYQNVLIECNILNGQTNIVATNEEILGVISNFKANYRTEYDNANTLRFTFTPKNWKRICEHAARTTEGVKFQLYRHSEEEKYDLAVALLDNRKIRSTDPELLFPNWRSVIPQEGHHVSIHYDDIPHVQRFVSKLKAKYKRSVIYVSCYRGSDILYFDDIDGYTEQTRTFRLSEPSTKTIGAALIIRDLKLTKPTGIMFTGGITIIYDENTDILLLAKQYNSSKCLFHVEQRELLPETAVA